MTIAVTGATGFVGQSLLDEADARGLDIRALTRRKQQARKGVSWVAGSLSDTASLVALAGGAQAIVHIAGVVNAADKAGFVAGNVEGAQAVVEAARQAGVQRFVHVSSLAAREPSLSDYGHSKRMAEEVVQVSGLDWTIVRPPAVYGPRDTEMFELFKAARWRVVPMPPPGRTSIIHARDLARLLLDLVHIPEASKRIYEPDDGRADGWSHRELAKAIGAAMNKRVWVPAMPASLLRGAARLDRKLRGEKAKLTPDRASYMTHPDWVSDPAHGVPPHVWQPTIETREGLRQTARWYRAEGWL